MNRKQAETAFVEEMGALQADWTVAAQRAAERRWRNINQGLSRPINLEALYMLGRDNGDTEE